MTSFLKWAIPEKKETEAAQDMEFPGGIEEIASGIYRGYLKTMCNFQG